MLSPIDVTLVTMNTSNNFTGLAPNITYSVTFISIISDISTIIMVTTSTIEAGRPRSE